MIRVARGLELPLSVVTEKTSILAKTGAGKSNTAKVIVEGVMDAGAQVVVMDPVSHWWGLRSLFPIPVIGGMMGDVPLDPLAGKLMARIAAESGQSMVLDLSLFDSDGQMQRFAYEFAEEFYKQKLLHPTAVLLVLEEADEFAPQNSQGPNVARMVGAFNRIAKRGRGRGIGMLNVTLRSAALNKNVLNQSDTIIAMRTTAPLDLDAVQEWVKYHRLVEGAKEVVPSLPGLDTGVAYFWTPERKVLVKVRVNKARSLDTSATPEVGVEVERPKGLKVIDLAELGDQMKEFAEKAKQDDPKELRAELAAARREVERLRADAEHAAAYAHSAHTPGNAEDLPGWETFFREQGWMPDDELPELSIDVNAVVARVVEFASELGDLLTAEIENQRREPTVVRRPAIVSGAGGKTVLRPARKEVAPAPAPTAPAPAPRKAEGVTAPQQKILDALAWWSSVGVVQPTVGQIAFVVGYHARSKGFTNNLSALSSAGLIERGQGVLSLTAAGVAAANQPGSPPSDYELQQRIFEQIGSKRAQMLGYLIEKHPEWVPMEQLAGYMDYHERSKGFTNNVSSLSGLGLVERGRGTVRASSLCFVGQV